MAAIAGPLAEALHGIPENMRAFAEKHYLADASDIVAVMKKMYDNG